VVVSNLFHSAINLSVRTYPASNHGGNEELRAVGVRSSISHGKETGLGVLQCEVLVCEFLAVDGLSTSSVPSGEVTSLQHELRTQFMSLLW